MEFRTTIEPFKIKAVEPIHLSTPEEREKWLRRAGFNPFMLKSSEVIIDLLTDSGTSAMSAKQWGGVMVGDEAYAGASSWERMEKVVKELTGFKWILPTHQGRAAERILYGHLGGPDKVFISNTHFDTTRANIEYTGAEAVDCVVSLSESEEKKEIFRGNLDTNKLEEHIQQYGKERVSAVILTVTNNSGGGQPVSMANAKAVKQICNDNNIPFFLDACRIAENAWFIRTHEKGYEKISCYDIAREMFRLADGCVMSAKKDAFANMGGFLALQDKTLAEACTNMLIITEGYTTYGGLSGRDMEAIATGLEEIFQPEYLDYRIKSTAYLCEHLHSNGVPVIRPAGGHAVYVDAMKFLPHIPQDQYPGQALVCGLYRAGGVRAVEIGSVMFGKYDQNNKLIPAPSELVRLAIPRRVYTQSHIDYVIESFEKLMEVKDKLSGLRIIKEPKYLRHFTAVFEELG